MHQLKSSIAVVVAALVLCGSAQATITTTGDLAGGGTPYNGTDDPWITQNLIVGNTAPAASQSPTGHPLTTLEKMAYKSAMVRWPAAALSPLVGARAAPN